MLKRIPAAMLACFLLSFVCVVPIKAGPQTGKEAEVARKVKTKIAKLGSGSKARVEVKMKNDTTVKGHVSEISEDHFLVADKMGTSTKVNYAEVTQLKTDSEFADRKVWIALVVFPVVLILSLRARGN
jgi:hypothetical protein